MGNFHFYDCIKLRAFHRFRPNACLNDSTHSSSQITMLTDPNTFPTRISQRLGIKPTILYIAFMADAEIKPESRLVSHPTVKCKHFSHECRSTCLNNMLVKWGRPNPNRFSSKNVYIYAMTRSHVMIRPLRLLETLGYASASHSFRPNAIA